MRWFLIALCAVAGLSGRVAAQERSGNPPVLLFDTTEHNFGRISEKGGKVSYVFGFVNTGSTPAVIIEVSVSCKCTRVDFPHKPVAPGERSTITVTYDPKGQPGTFYKAIQVLSTTPDKRQIITVKGEVY